MIRKDEIHAVLENPEEMKNNIVLELVNTEQNKELLGKLPHRQYMDLSITYRLIVKASEEGIASARINETLLEKMGLDEEALYYAAIENTKRIFPPMVKSMGEVIKEEFEKDDDMLWALLSDGISDDQTMFVISNSKGFRGAASMLYENNLRDLAIKLNTDLYIMPSSIHEVIAVSANGKDPNELAQMVTNINMDQVEPNERLSNQVYHYDKDLRKMSMATNITIN